MNPDYDNLWSTVVAGHSSVGKSCFILRFANDVYTEDMHTEDMYREFDISDTQCKYSRVKCQNSIIKFYICETTKHEAKDLKINIKRVHGVFVLYSVLDKISFDFAQQTVNKFQESGLSKIIVLVATKTDLEPYKREVSFEEGEAFANSFSSKIPFIEVSSKTNKNVDNAFKLMNNLMYSHLIKITDEELSDISYDIERHFIEFT